MIFFVLALFAAALPRMAVAFQVDANLPAGNAVVEKIDGNVVTLRQDLRDTDGDWIYWKIRVTDAEGRTLKFKFTKSAAVGSRGPAVSLDRGKTWTWGDDLQPAKQREPQTGDHPDWLGFEWTFGPKDGEVWFSQTIPYDPADWEAFLARHAAERGKIFETGFLCKSRKGRDISYARFGRLDGKAPVRIFLSSRHHCQETTATFVLEGIVARVFADDELGRWLRENVEFRVVPFVDYDGVVDGDQGKRRKPHDHARDYSEVRPAIYPEVDAVMRMLRGWSPTIVNDFHCPWLRGNWFQENNSNEYFYQVGLPDRDFGARQQAFGHILERVQESECGYRSCDDYWFGRGWNAGANYTQGMTVVQWATSVFKDAKFISSWEIPFANARTKTLHPSDFRAFGGDLANAYKAFLTDDANAQLHGGMSFANGCEYKCAAKEIHVYEKDTRLIDDPRYYHQDSDKPLKTAFFLKGLKDVTLDFGGATLVIHGKYQPFIVDQCTNVTIRNVTVKFSRSPFTEGVVVSASPRQLVMKVDKKVFPYEVKDGNCIFRGEDWVNSATPNSSFLQFFDGETRHGTGIMLVAVGKDAVINPENPWAKYTLPLIPSEREGLLVLDANRDNEDLGAAKPGQHAVIAHEERTQSNCLIVDSRDVTLSHYRILNGHGMGVFSFHAHNITLDHLRLEYDKDSPGFVANHADGIHAFGTSGDYIIRDSVLEGTIDDTLNIHSSFFVLQSAKENRIVADTRHSPCSTTALYEPGDRIRVTRGSTLEPVAEYTIVKTEPIDRKHVAITVDRKVGKHEKGDTIENLSTQCRIHILRSRFGRVNSHMRLQTRGEILIEDSELNLPVLLTGDMNFWYESSPCEKLTFRNVAFTGPLGFVRSEPIFIDTPAKPYYHGRIRLENCTFEKERPVEVAYTESVELVNCRSTTGNKPQIEAVNSGTIIAPNCEIIRKTVPPRTVLGDSY